MKKTFRFMAMAVAAIVMAGTTLACDPMDSDEENKEQITDDTENEGTENEGTENEGTENEGTENEGTENEGTENEGTENEGTENEGETPVAISLDGKQWVAVTEEGVSGYCFDFGVTTEGYYIECNISLNPASPAYYKFTPYVPGEYIIEPETETSGTVTVQYMGVMHCVYAYQELTATSVEIEDPITGMPGNFITFTVAEQLIVDQEVSEE